LFIGLLIISSYIYVDKQSYEDTLKNYNSKLIDEFETGFGSVYSVFKNTSAVLYEGYITNEEILALLYKGMYLKQDAEKIRNTLKKEFDNIYTKLQSIGFSQIHFHDKDGYSFLRMHRPEKYGDYLASIRPLIKEVIESHKPIEGYEVGVHEGGFRFIFPLFYNNTYIGSVETSVPIDKFLAYMSKELKSEFTVLYHEKALSAINKEIFKKKFFRISSDNDFYLDVNLPNTIIDKYAYKIISQNLEARYKKNKSFVINLTDEKEYCSLVFINLDAYNKEHIAHIVRYVKSPEIGTLRGAFFYKIFSAITIFAMTFLFIGFVIYRNKILSGEITKRKEIEEKLKDINKKFEIVIKNSGQIVYDYNTETDEIFRTGAIEETLGYSEEEFGRGSYKFFKSIYHKDDIKNVEKYIETILKENKNSNITYRLKRKDGTYATFLDESTVVTFSGQKHIFGVMKDITESLKTQEQLRRAQQLESIGILAGGIAHDFNNILSGIYNYLEIMRLSCHDEKTSTILSKIFGSFERAKSLTTQLLTFSKGGEPVIRLFNIEKLVKNIADFSLSGSSLKYEIKCGEDLLCCLGDENQIGQVIENIIINARQASPSNGLVKISIENISGEKAKSIFNNNELKNKYYALVTISDNGKGISEENLNRIFEPFFTTKEKGHGLGLSIAYNIIKKHNGDIIVESEPGKGTRFYIAIEASAEKCDNHTPEIKKDGSQVLNILIMDDEEDILNSLSELLHILGHNTFCAKNGEEAIKIYKEYLEKGEKIDLCILDITIKGGLGGKETISELIKIDKFVQAVVSSGYSDDPIMANPCDYGFVSSIQKPFKLEEINKLLEQLINLKKFDK
jgi:PAS domain S-box-containing protein